MKGSNLSYDLSPPGIHSFLPHTAHRPLALQPAFKLTNSKPSNNGLVRRQQVSVVLGVPTVRRDHQSYLSVTLRSVFDNLSPEEAADCLVVVLVAETDMEAVRAVAQEVKEQFSEHIDSGLLEVHQLFSLSISDRFTMCRYAKI